MSASLFAVQPGNQTSLYLDDEDLLNEEEQKELYPDSHTLGQVNEKPPTFMERVKLYDNQTEQRIYNQIKESVQNQYKSNEGKIGNELIQTLSNLPIFKQIGDYNESQQVNKLYTDSRYRRGKEGLLLQGMQSIEDILGGAVGLPFQAIEAALDVGSYTLNMDKRILGGLKDIALFAKSAKVSKSGKFYQGTQNLKAKLNQKLGLRPRIYKGSTDGAVPMEKTNLWRNQKAISDYTYGGYLRDYPSGTGATGAGSGAAYIAESKLVANALAGNFNITGPKVLLSVRPTADPGAIGDLNLIPKAGALYGKMNRQGKAGKESGERIASKFASPLEITQFNKKYGGISRRLLGAVYTSPFAPHHLVPHEDAARINIRGDAEQVWTAINNLSPRKHTPGNVRENLIGAMHRKNAAFIQSGKESIIQQKPEWVQTSKPYTWNDPYLGKLTSTPDRILKDIIKDPGDAPYPSEIKSLSSIGLPESGVWPSGNKVTPKQKAVAWKERFNYWGIKRKQVKFDPKGDIIGVDHVEIGHAAIKLHPKYKEMQELLNNRDLYLSKSAKEAAAIIEPGLRVAENVFININKLRLDLIKEHLGFLTRTGIDKNGRPKFKSNPTIVKQYEGQVTERIVKWISDNPAKAASLGGSLLTKDLNKMLKWLDKDPGKLTDEFNKVFSAEIQNEASMTEPPSSQQLSDLKDKFNK